MNVFIYPNGLAGKQFCDLCLCPKSPILCVDFVKCDQEVWVCSSCINAMAKLISVKRSQPEFLSQALNEGDGTYKP